MNGLVKTSPVATFRYRGSHSKPVRRTVLITEATKEWITGYEVREGNTTREYDKAPIKTFVRSKMAKDETTGRTSLRRTSLSSLENSI